jgi:hypothetical protein
VAVDEALVRTVMSLEPPATAWPAWWTTVPSEVRTVRVRRELRSPPASTARCTALRSHDIAHGSRSPPLGLHPLPLRRPPRPLTRRGNVGSVLCSEGSAREWRRCERVACFPVVPRGQRMRASLPRAVRLTRISGDLGEKKLLPCRGRRILVQLGPNSTRDFAWAPLIRGLQMLLPEGLVRLHQTISQLEWVELELILYKSKFVSNYFNLNQYT